MAMGVASANLVRLFPAQLIDMFSIPRSDVTREWRDVMAFWSRRKRQAEVGEPPQGEIRLLNS